MNILSTLDSSNHRLEEIAKNYMTFGKLTHTEYLESIDKVTSEQINRVATKAMQGLPSIVILGSAINEVPTITDVQKMLDVRT